MELRALHDVLEEAYFGQMALARSRWFFNRGDGYLLGGMAGLDSPTMSRVGLLDVPPPRLPEVISEADRFFGERDLPWSVHLTPFTRPLSAAALLEARGFHLASALSVMTWRGGPPPAHGSPGIEVVTRGPEAAASLTALTIEGFRMPARYLPALTDLTEAWLRAGGAAYVARVDGEDAGTALLARCEGVAGVYNVCTLRSFRRRGVASALMARILQDYARKPGDVLTLQVARDSVAEGMYVRMGFARRYEWDLWLRD